MEANRTVVVGPMKAVSASSQAGSDLNTSTGTRQNASIERRVAWLEEDVAVLHRRVKTEVGEIGGAAGDSGLRALVGRLHNELAQERHLRELQEARLASMEEQLKREQRNREASMTALSKELETMVKKLIGRIDQGLSFSANSMKERTDQTEMRMRSMLQRVDEGITAAAAIQEDPLVEASPNRATGGGSRRSPSPLKQEEAGLNRQAQFRGDPRMSGTVRRQTARSPQASQCASMRQSPVQTPCSTAPTSLQVPGAGVGIRPTYAPVPYPTVAGYPGQAVPGSGHIPVGVMGHAAAGGVARPPHYVNTVAPKGWGAAAPPQGERLHFLKRSLLAATLRVLPPQAMTPEAEKVGAGELPAGVQGTMDGEKPPMSQVEELKKVLEPLKQRYGHYLTQIRPWRDFIRLSKPEGDIQRRLQVNLTHFQINYAVIFLIQMLVAIITNPQCLVVISVLAIIWMMFLKKNDDPNWEVSIGGMQLGKTQRWMALSAITAIVLLSVVGQVFFSATFFCGILVIVHGILHPVPEPAFDEINEVL
ncbi:PRA1F2 [Symbiodinium microadriaticum]|nr:PRA1F2 [Symbiodinium microadriaticum]